jgi:hypothetical protein
VGDRSLCSDAFGEGCHKALILLGHPASEEAGMEECERWLLPVTPELRSGSFRQAILSNVAPPLPKPSPDEKHIFAFSEFHDANSLKDSWLRGRV